MTARPPSFLAPFVGPDARSDRGDVATPRNAAAPDAAPPPGRRPAVPRTARALALAGATALAACGSPPALATVPDRGGPRVAHPRLVPITWANDTARGEHEAYVRWIAGSDWLATVGDEYGIGAGSVPGVVELTAAAPAHEDETSIAAWLFAGVADGTIVAPTPGAEDTIYVIFYPAGTTIVINDDGRAVQSCAQFGGIHLEAVQGSLRLPYVVVPDCGPTVSLAGGSPEQFVQVATSHEIFEAATDPSPFASPAFEFPTAATDTSTAWTLIGGELADLCDFQVATEAGWAVQRIWSNRAAAAMHDPCVPASGAPYFNVTSDPGGVIDVPRSAPRTMDLTIRGWSTGSVGAWSVGVEATPGVTAAFDGFVATSRLSAGATARLHVALPATVLPGQLTGILLVSFDGMTGSHAYPVRFLIH